jgi:hypothetical protein
MYFLLLLLCGLSLINFISPACNENEIFYSNFYCEIYYKCEFNRYVIKYCEPGTVINISNCITQSEYKKLNGEECMRCNEYLLYDQYNKIECSKLSNYKCCFKKEDYIIYCDEYENNKYYWKKDRMLKDCNLLLQNRNKTDL